jgi:hypothetical protein
MSAWPWPRIAVIALLATLALLVVSQILGLIGAAPDLVVALSYLNLVTFVTAFLALIAMGARRVRWSLALAVIALVTQTAAALLLLIQEPQPAFLHPEWAWYWPVVNTLYFGGAIAAIIAIISGALGYAMTRLTPAAVAFALGMAAMAINRLAPYR